MSRLDRRRVLITGGAGFVGSSLALRLVAEGAADEVTAFDNLKRRGSELNLERLARAGVRFVHGDIRCPEDLEAVGDFDVLIDCAAEPSVHAGAKDGPAQVVSTNLVGTIHCLELARRRGASFLFVSTSRVYPIARLNTVPWTETGTRFVWRPDAGACGISPRGVTEDFPLAGARSLYGATKLSGELLVSEYAQLHGVRALIDRCGVLAGPWQMGRVDQGVVSLWVARHVLGGDLAYTGFGGEGKQVRDILHIEDFGDLVLRQLASPESWDGRVYNVGGGVDVSVSLLELTELCREVTGREIPIGCRPETAAVDLRVFVTDHARATSDFGWRPRRTAADIVHDLHDWLLEHERSLEGVLVG